MPNSTVKKQFASQDDAPPDTPHIFVSASSERVLTQINIFLKDLCTIQSAPPSTRVRLYVSGVGLLPRPVLLKELEKIGVVKHLAMHGKKNVEKAVLGHNATAVILVQNSDLPICGIHKFEVHGVQSSFSLKLHDHHGSNRPRRGNKGKNRRQQDEKT